MAFLKGCPKCKWSASISKAGNYCPNCGTKLVPIMDERELDDYGKKPNTSRGLFDK